MSAPGVRVAPGADGVWVVSGDLDMHSVPQAWRAMRRAFTDRAVVLDLSAVERMDSAGLALLVEWSRQAGLAGGVARFRNIPEQLQAMAQVYGVDRILDPQPA
ncbi:MAG: STAS domain-containing protein [Gammaproteobacteria bacterium]